VSVEGIAHALTRSRRASRPARGPRGRSTGRVGNAETHRDHGAFSIHRVPNARPDEIGPAVVARRGAAHPRGLARPAALGPAHRARSLPRRPHDPAQPMCASEAKTKDRKARLAVWHAACTPES
jgi:hypothetical protein